MSLAPSLNEGKGQRCCPQAACQRDGVSDEIAAANSTTTGRLIRGLVVAPGLGLIAFLTDWPTPLRAAAVVLLVLSLISAITGHCFLYDLMWWRDDRTRH